ncbi:hypothetical protein KU306_17165 (plasmid) [Haloferax larsenii]|uniref:HNH endonuclease n=2 Tax=Haloferax larsenii TaxID=302484 RepID=A0ABY5RIP5_HALLR|nr:hypothetical protein KU306_17165 [Haloferax larsenii]
MDDEGRVPREGLPGTAGGPNHTGRQYHQHGWQFVNYDVETGPASCEVCAASIPPTRARCVGHRETSPRVAAPTDYEWSISKTAIAVIPASNRYHAIAIGSSSFRLRDGGHKSRSSYELFYDLDDPARILTAGWGSIPDAVPLDSNDGQRLFETAVDKTDWETTLSVEQSRDVTDSSLSDSNPHIFTETGDGLVNRDQLADFDEQPHCKSHDYWVVPAVLYDRKHNTTDKTVRNRTCPNCSEATQHVFDGYDGGHPSTHVDGAALWTCLTCDTTHDDTPPVGVDPDKPWEDSDYTGGDRYTPEDAAEQQHEQVMRRLENEDMLE